MAPQLKSAIDTLIQSNKVVVFMKVRSCSSSSSCEPMTTGCGAQVACSLQAAAHQLQQAHV
jgi:hypothetical protein